MNLIKQFLKNTKLVEIIFLNFLAISVYGQVNFRSGCIITNNLDTVYGKIDYRRDYRMCHICIFKSKTIAKKKYYPGDIKGYKFENERFFETFNIDGNPKFLELLIKGEISIYFYVDETKYRYFLKKRDTELVELKYSEYYVLIDKYGIGDDGKLYDSINYPHAYFKAGKYLIKSKEYKKILLDSLKDEPELASDINSLKNPNHLDLINIAKKYHELKHSDIDLIVYNNLHLKSDYIFTIGQIRINLPKVPANQKFNIYSFKGYIPLMERKLYLGYGLQYACINPRLYTYKIYRIPLSIRYQYPGKIFKPSAAFGLNIYYINDGSKYEFVQDFIPSYAIGLAIKLYKNVYSSFGFEGDLCWNTYYNSSTTALFSKSYNLGLMISL